MQNALFEPAPFDPRLPVAARGTEGSNLAPSSGESGANLTPWSTMAPNGPIRITKSFTLT
jgi:hypothetical protein